jgi:uncharacterized protein YdaU (DUF1376 family)
MTFEQEGLYIRLCALIYSRGGPLPSDRAQLSRLCHADPRNLTRVLSALISRGSCREVGETLTILRCEVELKSARLRAEVGRKNVANRWKLNGSDHTNGLASGNANHQPSTTNHQLEEKKNAREARSPSLKADFADWWQAYPHKIGKGAAEAKFILARKAGITLADLIEGVRRYVGSKPPDHPWCNPATWLYQRRWEDQPAFSLDGGGVDVSRPHGPAPSVAEAYGRGIDDPLERREERR